MGDGCTAVIVCAICCCVPALASLIIVLALTTSQTHMPRCSIQDLYVPALNTKLPHNITTTFIFFDLEIKNDMEEVGVRYRDLNLTFYFGGGRNSSNYISIANFNIPRFYQGHKKTAHFREVVETRGVPWSDALTALSDGGSTVVLRVELSTRVHLKRDFGIKSKEKELMLGGDVEVNGAGEKFRKKGVRLVKRRVSI